jgi:ADP-heptose:LPS heptosyltransferase
MRKLILRNFQSPGDILMLTAALRDLHRHAPGQFLTDVRTSCMELWANNPYLTPLEENAPDVEVIDCRYPLIQQSNNGPHHFLQGFMMFLNEKLGLNIQPTAFHGDVHLSESEKSLPAPVAERVRSDVPYWIIVAGGKYDYTIKWWHFRRYQAVVDAWRGRALFVQVGERRHYHPELSGVIDLRGRTPLRELMRLMYHAQGVLCPVTFLMHLAAAVEWKARPKWMRPCVVVAGGREPVHWEAYPTHQFIHSIGAIPCCSAGACWRSRTLPLGDGDDRDAPDSLCVDVVNGLPHCMDMITPEEVVRRMRLYYDGGTCRLLTAAEARLVEPFLKPGIREHLGIDLRTVDRGVQPASAFTLNVES